MQNMKKNKGPPLFIRKLTDILHNKKHQHIVSWTTDHNSFTIKCIVKFTEEILPFYYKHRNYSSFLKQLNMYNFAKVQQPSEGQNVYKHKNFKKSHPQQLELIKRRNPLRKIQQQQNYHRNNIRKVQSTTVDMTQEGKLQELYKIKQRLTQLELVCKKLFIQNDFIIKEMSQYLEILDQQLRLNHQKMQNILYKFLIRTQNPVSESTSKENLDSSTAQSLSLMRFQMDGNLKKIVENILYHAELDNFPNFFLKFLEESFGVTSTQNNQYLKLCFFQHNKTQFQSNCIIELEEQWQSLSKHILPSLQQQRQTFNFESSFSL